MSEIAYTVSCTFDAPEVAERWLDWLREGHLADVVAAGATAAYGVKLDGTPVVCQARYRFASREAFETYEREHAPRLRDEGLERFPLTLGLHYERAVGVVTG